MKRSVRLAPAAVRQLRRFSARDRAVLVAALEAHLANADPTKETRHRLRRPSEFAEFELRVGTLRAFYRVAGRDVEVVLIGKKVGNALLIEGKRFVL